MIKNGMRGTGAMNLSVFHEIRSVCARHSLPSGLIHVHVRVPSSAADHYSTGERKIPRESYV